MNLLLFFDRITLIIFVVAFFSCASTKKIVYTPAGSWNYVVSNTPQGNIKGTMVITQDESLFSGVLNSSAGKIDLNNVEIIENGLNATFNYQGYQFRLKGLFEGESFNGNVSFSEGQFPIIASREIPKSK